MSSKVKGYMKLDSNGNIIPGTMTAEKQTVKVERKKTNRRKRKVEKKKPTQEQLLYMANYALKSRFGLLD